MEYLSNGVNNQDQSQNQKKSFWLTTCFVNLFIVAILGFLLRSKIVFSLPFLDFKNLLNAHSHYAFSAWVTLCFLTLFIYELLPSKVSGKKIYQWILWGVQLSSVGMLCTFPFVGYSGLSIFFSTAFIFATYIFAWVFIKDLLKAIQSATLTWLTICAIACLVLSSIGPFGLAYIVITKQGNPVLYRDFLYTFLHFQYNGFFTLSVFVLFINKFFDGGRKVKRREKLFFFFLCLSVVPTLFLSLSGKNHPQFFYLAIAGCICICFVLYFFVPLFKSVIKKGISNNRLAYFMISFALFSFFLKMAMMAGTIIPSVRHAIFGDRPIIIGYLHLVFLGMVTMYIFYHLVEEKYFSISGKIFQWPFVVFIIGVVANEAVLMLQGLGILFNINSQMYSWMLWYISAILMIGAGWLFLMRLRIHRQHS